MEKEFGEIFSGLKRNFGIAYLDKFTIDPNTGKKKPEKYGWSFKEVTDKGEEWWFVDTGYFSMPIKRYPEPSILDKNKTYFRIVKGKLHTTRGKVGTGQRLNELENKDLYLNRTGKKNAHPIFQCLGSSFVEQNKNQPFLKIFNPWSIKTPSGYSCLFLPPLNNKDDRFEIIPGIVDTDSFISEVHFPCIFNGYKYESLETTIKAGTPYVQVIPFKKESWRMILKEKKEDTLLKLFSIFVNRYKKLFWNKTSWI
jgi:hypothetical protein